MRKLFDWVFAKSRKPEFSAASAEYDGAEENAEQKYKVQVKYDLVREHYNWRIIETATGYEPRTGLMTKGTAYTERGAIKAGRKRIEKIEQREKNREQRWEDVDV